jgi:preprotein translocase subunit YajC
MLTGNGKAAATVLYCCFCQLKHCIAQVLTVSNLIYPGGSMFVTPAYAQATGAGGAPEMLMSILPFILIFVIMYFLIIRPQRTAAKKREEQLKNIRRGDTVITGGGFIAKVTKVYEETGELDVEIGDGVKARVLRGMVADVRVKGEPVADNKK